MIYSPTPDRRCARCLQWFPATLEHFYLYKRRNSDLYSYCKRCARDLRKKYHRAHKENNNKSCRRYYAEHQEERRQHAKAYRLQNPEKWRTIKRRCDASHRTQRSKSRRVYNLKHPELARIWSEKRRGRVLKAAGSFSADDVKRQYKSQKGKCYWCNETVGDTYHVDHVIPLSRGGSNGPENIVIACPACNLSKGNRLPHEWGSGGKLL